MTTALYSDAQAARREEVVRLGLWLFLGTVMMLFAAFSSAYIVRRAGTDWVRIVLPDMLVRNTMVLLASSAALEVAWHSGYRLRRALPNWSVGTAVALGLLFVVGQWQAWQQLRTAGPYLPGNPSNAFFYMLTAAHGLHVMAALAVLTYAAVLTWRGGPCRDAGGWALTMAVCRTFWHFLLVMWLYLYAFMAWM